MPIEIDSDYPGGNIVVESIDGDDVRLHQDLRDTTHDWFYWCFRARGAQGRTLRFTFTRSRALGVRGAAVSLDGGQAWAWLGGDVVDGNAFIYRFPPDASDVRLSFGMPYQESHWLHFVEGLGDNPAVSCHDLCTTAKGRKVEYLLVGCRQAEALHRIAITCRHHCCEMMANYALEGLIQWLVKDNDCDAQWFRKNAGMFIVPFADKDGVEEGDQGKGRHPRDHGRDYEGESIFAATRAIRGLLPGWGDGKLRLGLDLHCPWISGPHHEVIYQVGSQDERTAIEQRRFSDVLETVRNGPLPFLAEDFLPFGEAWNDDKNCAGGKGFSRWVAELPGVVLGTAIEIPYANAAGAEVNQESARRFGQDLGRAVATYLQELPKADHKHRVEARR